MPRRLPQFNFSGYYDEPEVNPITMAMQLLGMESKQRGEEKSTAMDLYKLMEDRKAAEKLMGFEREKFGETQASGAATRELAKAQEDRLGRALAEDIAYKKGQQEIERQKLIGGALEKVAGVPQLSPEARLLIKNIPGMAEPYQQMERETEMKTVLPELQTAYADKDAAKRDAAIKIIYGKMSPYARENVNWQDLNQLIAPDKPGFWSRFSGSGTPPTAGTASEPTVAPPTRRGYGSVPGGAAGTPITETLGVQDPLRYLKDPNWQPAPTAPTTAPEFEYQAGYPSAKPDYMYPEDVRNAISGVESEESVRNRIESDPRYQSAEVNTLNAIKDWWNKDSSAGPEGYPLGAKVTQQGLVDRLMGVLGGR